MAIRKVPVVPWAILSKSLVVSFRTGITLSGLPGKGKGPRLPQLQVPSMLSLFQRKRPPVTASLSSSGDMEKGLMRPESVAALLSTTGATPAEMREIFIDTLLELCMPADARAAGTVA